MWERREQEYSGAVLADSGLHQGLGERPVGCVYLLGPPQGPTLPLVLIGTVPCSKCQPAWRCPLGTWTCLRKYLFLKWLRPCSAQVKGETGSTCKEGMDLIFEIQCPQPPQPFVCVCMYMGFTGEGECGEVRG